MYDYDDMKKDIGLMNPITTEVTVIGKSVMERDLYCLKMGRGEKKLLITGAHHGLEYITSDFLIRFARQYSNCLLTENKMFDSDVLNLFTHVTLYIVPMVNPDGVDIAVNGLDITNEYHRRLISMVGIHSFRKVWQANVRGVDLNHNYDALWHRTVEKPTPSLFGGDYPESEPETGAICGLIRRIMPDMLVCFHSQGKEIYYDFDGSAEKNAEAIALKMADVSGYSVAKPVGSASYGGCKDWFIKEFSRPGFTVEMGKGENPLPESLLDEIYDENAKIVLAGMGELLNLIHA